MDIMIPLEAETTETAAEQMMTCRNVPNRRIADSAGKMINAEVRSEPTRFMARTMMTAVMTAMNRLYRDASIPVAVAKFSSKVTAKILL